MPAAAASQSPAPPNLASQDDSLPTSQPPAIQTARTAWTRNPTTTHTSRPRAKAHSYLHSARDTQERRLVQSRSQSQPGQAREADSRPGPFFPRNQKEHRSKARSATPTIRDQAHPFYRRSRTPSISWWLVWGQSPPAVQLSAARWPPPAQAVPQSEP